MILSLFCLLFKRLLSFRSTFVSFGASTGTGTGTGSVTIAVESTDCVGSSLLSKLSWNAGPGSAGAVVEEEGSWTVRTAAADKAGVGAIDGAGARGSAGADAGEAVPLASEVVLRGVLCVSVSMSVSIAMSISPAPAAEDKEGDEDVATATSVTAVAAAVTVVAVSMGVTALAAAAAEEDVTSAVSAVLEEGAEGMSSLSTHRIGFSGSV